MMRETWIRRFSGSCAWEKPRKRLIPKAQSVPVSSLVRQPNLAGWKAAALPPNAQRGWATTPLILVLLFSSACARVTPTAAPILFPPTATPESILLPTTTLAPTPTLAPTEITTPAPTPAATRFAYAKNPRAVLIEADVSGGFAPVPRQVHMPTYRLYADGFVVFAGEHTNPASGLDAVARTGYLSDAEIQGLLNYLNQVEFFSLDAYYQPKPTPTDLPTWRLSVYLHKTKTVSVYAAGFPGTPENFSKAFARITQTVPPDAQTFTPTDGYLQTTLAGSVGDLGANVQMGDWSGVGVKLADAVDGMTVSGRNYSAIAALVSKQYPHALFREGDRAYRVNFSHNLPRAVHLTDLLGAIVDAPREFDGRTLDIVGYFRGANILGEAASSLPKTRSDWVIADASGALYVTGSAPAGLDLYSARDVWTAVRLRATVVYVRLGTSYLEARRVEIVPSNIASATPTPPSGADAAIAAVKAKYPEVAPIRQSPRGMIGASTDITVIAPRTDAWYLVFWEGSGDCPAGCINHRYYYFIVKDGQATKAGEYSRVYNSATNAYDTTGAPLWGVPSQ